MKKAILIFSILFSANYIFASTPVSGGIYSSITWTKANSPYIVTGTIVVFPGVTLTIQPGVTIEFNNGIMMELRQAQLIAVGNASDSIIFKSSSTSPTKGIYSGIYIDGGSMSSQFSYCGFSYADSALISTSTGSLVFKNCNFNNNNNGTGGTPDTLIIENCNFNNNNGGAGGGYNTIGIVNNCNFFNNVDGGLSFGNSPSTYASIKNCNFSNNGLGLGAGGGEEYDTCIHCVFTNNQVGMSMYSTLVDNCYFEHNQIGINGNTNGGNRVRNTTIDSNTVLGIYSTFGDSLVNCKVRYNGVGVRAQGSIIVLDTIEYNKYGNIEDTINSQCTTVFANVIENSPVGIHIDQTNSSFKITKNTIENNSIGINLHSTSGSISCNNICNNSTYNIMYGLSSNISAKYNNWCLSDSAHIRSTIYDGYTNISLGLVVITPFTIIPFTPPFDTTSCDSVGFLTSINNLKTTYGVIQAYPNPTNGKLFIDLHETIDGNLTLTNVLGQNVYSSEITGNNGSIRKIDISNLPQGIYFLRIESGGQVLTKKVMKI